MTDNAITIQVDGKAFRTLKDILPEPPGLRALIIGKTPTPVSVNAGHYFRGTQGRMFWKRLRQYGIFSPTTEFEDDSLLGHGFGLTDIVKVPRNYGIEPSSAEYGAGKDRVMDLIRLHRPSVIIFVYKSVLDELAKRFSGVQAKSAYGFNPIFEPLFGAPVFAFPLPGVGSCTTEQASTAMHELALILRPP